MEELDDGNVQAHVLLGYRSEFQAVSFLRFTGPGHLRPLLGLLTSTEQLLAYRDANPGAQDCACALALSREGLARLDRRIGWVADYYPGNGPDRPFDEGAHSRHRTIGDTPSWYDDWVFGRRDEPFDAALIIAAPSHEDREDLIKHVSGLPGA